MKNIFRVALILAISLFISCSEDETGRDLGQNGFSHGDTFYVLNNGFFNDENVLDETPSNLSIILSNVNLVSANAISNVSIVYFDFDGVTLQPGTYSNLNDYSIDTGGSFNAEGDYIEGNFLLDSTQSSLSATSSTVTINSIDDNKIDLTFTFTRNDGQIFSGKYVGLITDVTSPE